MIEFAYKPDWLVLAVGGVAVAAFLCWSYASARGRGRMKERWVLVALRALAVTLLVLCLLDPQRVKRIEHHQAARVAVLLDTSRSMGVVEEGRSRLDAMRDWVANELKLPKGSHVDYYGFSTNLAGLSDPGKAAASGGGSDLSAALQSLLEQADKEQPEAVVLLSDGADNSGKQPVELARRYQQKHIPIHAVLVGRSSEPPDIVVESVQAKTIVAAGSRSSVELQVRSPGFGGQTVPVQLTQGGKVLAEQNVKLNGAVQKVSLEMEAPEAGFQVLSGAVPVQNGERLDRNNRREFGLTVTDEKLRVIYMEASGIKQGVFQPLYLKHALEEDPEIEVKTLYCEQYGAPAAVQQSVAFVDPRQKDPIYHVENTTKGFPTTMEELLRYHVVISSDIPKDAFTLQQLTNTEKFVVEHGGGFVMIGGYTAFGAGAYNETIVDRIVPVGMELDSDTVGVAFQAKPTLEGLAHPLMNLGRTDAETREIWTTKFPQLMGFNQVDRPKPGATVLLEHPTLKSPSGPRVILAAQEIGNGRTMAFTSDTTYGWGEFFETIWGEPIDPSKPLTEANCDSRYYKAFWRNAMRWLGARKFEHESRRLEIMLDERRAVAGEPLPVGVSMASLSDADRSSTTVLITVEPQSVSSQSVKAEYDPARKSFEAKVALPGDGGFIIHARAQKGDTEVGEARCLVTVRRTDNEMDDLRARPEVLESLARISGGEYQTFTVSDASAPSRVLTATKPPIIESRRVPLLNTGTWLLVIVGILTAEWILRRIKGLA